MAVRDGVMSCLRCWRRRLMLYAVLVVCAGRLVCVLHLGAFAVHELAYDC